MPVVIDGSNNATLDSTSSRFNTPASSTAGDFNLKTNTVLANSNGTLIAAQMLQGQFSITPTAARILTTATAVNIIAAMPGYQVGSHFEFSIFNLAAFDVTLAAGVGVALVGDQVVNSGNKIWRCRIDSATTVTIRSESQAVVPVPAVPAGEVSMYAGSTAPVGYLFCNGGAVSRTTYAALFIAIGTAWGAGDGTTTFGLPDMRGRAPIGAGTGSGLSGRSLASLGGAETHSLTNDESPSHTHTYSDLSGSGTSEFGPNGTFGPGTSSTSATGGGAAHNNMQPFASLNFIIKT